jgi:hypothetical protein
MIINLKVSQPSTRSEKITGVVLFVWDWMEDLVQKKS